ncbi:hypothetical protein F0U44_05110 [Nocardioides humilatus]|uniref:Uncharacterized protein n=1 Tax=Nocardioides humilatus TaxID=2607660 RepID=A0A5B1LPZ6_9ACTN|nr:hypothetical protein [Nocardioides humilatus]KAA1421657.1 hypothetical protein F0U44_05110 [Nocardioides humilatus]
MARRSFVPLAALALVVIGLAPVVTQPAAAAAAGGYCSHAGAPGIVTYEWSGGGDGESWDEAANWDRDDVGAPPIPGGMSVGPSTTEATDYVCIPAGSTVELKGANDWNRRINALDVQGLPGDPTVVRLGAGAFLRVFGDDDLMPSVVRPNAKVVLNAGGWGGPGLTEVRGTMFARTSGGFAPGFLTRRCSTESCATAAVDRGVLVIANAGELLLDKGGVNLVDYYAIRVHGLVRLSNDGYLAADHGTRFELQPRTAGSEVGSLEIDNDGGYYEGATPAVDEGLSVFINNGWIRKTGGAGTSIVSAVYSAGAGSRVDVDSGTLALPDGAVKPVHVARGKRYGTASCSYDDSYVCTAVTDPGVDLQAVTFRDPRSDPGGAKVEAHQSPGDPHAPSGIIGDPMTVHAQRLVATAARPAIIEIRYDASLLGAQTPATVKILRRATGTTTYVKVPTCRAADGTPPGSAVACVDRRPGKTRTVAGGDLVVVVRTQATSRWVGR